MHCPTCSTENPPHARFCLQCGTRLSLTCPQCRTELPPDARFCLACGAPVTAAPQPQEWTAADLLKRHAPKEYVERLLATRGQAHDERRTVTILFADVKGSTAMEEKLDPEDVKEVMRGAFEVLISPIYRYEGTLVQLMGDAILAFFGAPIAHEDDPERACRAGLEITAEAAEYAEKLKRERSIEGFAVRVGINTGLVVVGEVGSDLRVAYTATGDTINLAARMEQNAAPGTVLITENTHKLIAPLFVTAPVGPRHHQGKAEPVTAYRVLAARPPQAQVRGIAGLQSPLVGRDAECAALSEALACLRSGVGGIVTIVGEAGLGKSRLVAELRCSAGCQPAARAEEGRNADCSRSTPRQHGQPAAGTEGNDGADYQSARRTGVQWLEGRCLSYGTSIAYLLWLDVLRNLLGVTVEDSPQQVLNRLRECTEALCADSAGSHFPYLARLLSLPLDAETESRLRDEDGQQLKSHTFQAVDALLRCAAGERPLVLVCEDLHWADPTSLELLERLLALTDRTSLLLILVFRPDLAHGSWQLRETIRRSYRHRHTDIELHPLSAADSQTLVGNLLQMEDLPADLRLRIIAAAEGNPFYVEEVIRGLMDGGAIARDEATGRWLVTHEVAEIVIPDTLQGVLVARLDRLEEDTRRVLQMAAVIGRVFLYHVLTAIAAEQRDLDGHLLTLQRQEMIRERARLPELEYIFKHELTREAAYNGILKADRRAFHRQVAEALERLFPERIDEQLGLLAYHWERAGDAARATGYLLRAGDQARLAYAHAEAVAYYQRALAFMQDAADPGPAARTWMKLGLTYHSAFDFGRAGEAYDRAFALRQEAERGRRASRVALPPAPHAFRRAWVSNVPIHFDPGVANNAPLEDIIREMFSGLLEVTPDLDSQPDVAREWEVLEGGRRYVFHLRDDVYWSDGTPVTAGDFEYSCKRVLEPRTISEKASMLYDISKGCAFHQGQVTDAAEVGVSAPDPRTLVVELEGPSGCFLSVLACTATFPVPRHAVEAHGQDWAQPERVISNGAFLLRTWQPGQAVILERNPRYHGRRGGNVGRVEFRLFPVSRWSAASEMYEADQLDTLVIGSTYGQEWTRQRLAADYVWERVLSTHYLGFVASCAPFDDVRVRRAFAMAVDRQKLPAVAFGRLAPATSGFVPPGMPGHSPGIALPYDPQGARRLLAEAGYPQAHGLPVLELLTTEGGGVALARNLQAQWAEGLGADIRTQAVDLVVPALAATSGTAPPHMFLQGWIADYPDPDNLLRVGLPREQLRWRNEAYERLVEDARRCMDQAERMRLYRRADKILVEDVALLPLSYGRWHVLAKPWAKLRLSPQKAILSKDVIIEPH